MRVEVGIGDVGIGDIQVHASAIRVENPMALGDIEPGDGYKIRTENRSETPLRRMGGLGGKLIPVIILIQCDLNSQLKDTTRDP